MTATCRLGGGRGTSQFGMAATHGALYTSSRKLNQPISQANEISGCQLGNQRRQALSDARRLPSTIGADSWHNSRRLATSRDGPIAPYKRGVTGRTQLRPPALNSKRWRLTCENAMRRRLLLSGWLRLFTAEGDWLRPIRAEVSRPRRRVIAALGRWPDRRRVPVVVPN
jgi:hypothetical protein